MVSFAALMALVSMSGKVRLPSMSTGAFKIPTAYKAPAEPMLARGTSGLVALPLSKCAVSWANGGNYVLATPSACNGVAVQGMTIRASEKACAQSSDADFRSLTNTTYFKGDFGFFIGQGKVARCLVVEQMVGRYI